MLLEKIGRRLELQRPVIKISAQRDDEAQIAAWIGECDQKTVDEMEPPLIFGDQPIVAYFFS